MVRIILTSSPNNETSLKLSRSLTEKRLAACVSVIPGIRSLYWWEGKVQEDNEELLLIKTAEEKMDSALSLLRSLHPYETPELIVINPELVDKKYAAWLASVVTSD